MLMQAMLNPLKWKYEDRVGLLVSTIAAKSMMDIGKKLGDLVALPTFS